MNAGVLVVLRFPAPAFIAFGTSWQKVGSFLETAYIYNVSWLSEKKHHSIVSN